MDRHRRPPRHRNTVGKHDVEAVDEGLIVKGGGRAGGCADRLRDPEIQAIEPF